MNITARAAVHPFPARMAPELAAGKIAGLEADAVVLDPMMGSGTFPIAAARSGHRSFGCDTDPLALVIANTLAAPYDLAEYLTAADDVFRAARAADGSEITVDKETSRFIDFWFDPIARQKLAALANAINDAPCHLMAPLWCAFSRLIISKDSGASRARDVSHSRPHRVREFASFDPIERFPGAVKSVAMRVTNSRDLVPPGTSDAEQVVPVIVRADARSLPFATASVDAVMTSPPYLIAIDYLRGHRMSLVWMGHSISSLRALRSGNIGSEVGLEAEPEIISISKASAGENLPARSRKIVNRYVRDLDRAVSEIARVVKPAGVISFVIADARMNGVTVSIEEILMRVGDRHSLAARSRVSRELPETRRYLPPPRDSKGALNGRMKEEIILTFERS
ncbi:hypothetical protein OHB39_09930 [Streptomyces sp. NBC_00047]|uniref:hypothetical protein n=1 Tax=Streptomyces sp. NBC_00047 TaxID=2975627 RepID=UPI00224DBA39|nr:hypothetical protein [Streptomyces sp. NBC_00047]MCX5607887.1 hypothetical protein [Streptomyces sp. NBC_00047]